MALKLLDTVINILRSNPEKYYTARELAESVYKNKPKECENKMKSTKAATFDELIQQLVREIGSLKNDIVSQQNIRVTEERPRKYYYSEKSDIEEIEQAEQITKKNEHPEHDLYPLLCEYLYNELDIYPKRINEKKSSNSKGSNGNKWLHPDIVGLKNLSANWNGEVIKCANEHAFDKTSLWSFEVKVKINLSNVREYFFQTVSNSSWANNSYLVAAEIDEKAMQELKILCYGHNIGLIKLNKENPSESQILIPAIENDDLDWNMINRISEENPDFKEFINRITEFYQTEKIKETEWDIPKDI